MTICVTSVSVVYLNRKFVNGKIPRKTRFPVQSADDKIYCVKSKKDLLKFGLVDTLEEDK